MNHQIIEAEAIIYALEANTGNPRARKAVGIGTREHRQQIEGPKFAFDVNARAAT
jgi:hypothetical protein